MQPVNHVDQNQNTPHVNRKPDEKPEDAESNILVEPPLAQSHPTEPQQGSTSTPEKDWWDKSKRWVELAGILLLALYTGFTIAMYFANRKSADAAKSAADTAAKALKDSEDSFAQDLAQMKAQTKAQQDAAAIAGNSVKIIQESMRFDQRAWVGGLGVPNLTFTVGEPIVIEADFNNSGKTPALHVRVDSELRSMRLDETLSFTYPPRKGVPSLSTIQPGQHVSTRNRSEAPLTQAQLEGLKAGTYIIYLYGKFTYEDIFKRPHRTRFCLIVNRDLKRVDVCGKYNEAD